MEKVFNIPIHAGKTTNCGASAHQRALSQPSTTLSRNLPHYKYKFKNPNKNYIDTLEFLISKTVFCEFFQQHASTYNTKIEEILQYRFNDQKLLDAAVTKQQQSCGQL
jgi:hypothetical protein